MIDYCPACRIKADHPGLGPSCPRCGGPVYTTPPAGVQVAAPGPQQSGWRVPGPVQHPPGPVQHAPGQGQRFPGPGQRAPQQPRRPGQPPRPSRVRWSARRPPESLPPARAPRRGPRPTPRYRDVPRWGLRDVPLVPETAHRRRSSTAAGVLGALLIGTAGTLFIAGLGQLWLYVLIYVNQSVPVSATQAGVVAYVLFLGGWASLLAVAAAMLTSLWWLVAARADAYAAAGEREPRALWRLVAGWLLPVVNLVFAWVFLRELADARGASAADLARLRVGYRLWLVCNVFGGVVITIGQVSGSVGFVAEIAGGYAWRANAVGIAAVVDVLAAAVCVLAARELRRPVGVTAPARRWVLAG